MSSRPKDEPPDLSQLARLFLEDLYKEPRFKSTMQSSAALRKFALEISAMIPLPGKRRVVEVIFTGADEVTAAAAARLLSAQSEAWAAELLEWARRHPERRTRERALKVIASRPPQPFPGSNIERPNPKGGTPDKRPELAGPPSRDPANAKPIPQQKTPILRTLASPKPVAPQLGPKAKRRKKKNKKAQNSNGLQLPGAAVASTGSGT